jgi:predicted amidophosphoribosyltransferase
MQNLQNVFSPIDLDFEFGNLVIVDDLITTGATLENLISCIKKQFKNLNVYAIVLARR